MMLRSLAACRGFSVAAQDGVAGSVADVYFDERMWVTNLLVVDLGGWLNEHSVLIATSLVRAVDWAGRTMHVSLQRHQIEKGADPDSAKPVSRQDEGTVPRWEYTIAPDVLRFDSREDSDRLDWQERKERTGESQDPYLRSSRAVIGYAVQAFDGAAGEVKDFLFDEETWAIRQMMVDTRIWWPGGEVLVPVARIAHVNYHYSSVVVDLTRDELRNQCPGGTAAPPR